MPGTESQAREGVRASLLERIGAAGASISSLEPSHPRLRLALKVGLPGIVLACLLLAVAAQWRELPDIAWRLEPGWLALSLAAFLLFQVMHMETWRLIVRSLGGELAPGVGRAIYNTTLLARYVPTNALMVVARVALSKREGVERRICLASIVYEGALEFSAALTVGAYFVIKLPALAGEPLRWLVLAVPLAALIGLHPRVFHPLADFALRRLGREALPLSLSGPRVALFGAAYLLSFLLAGLGVYAFAQAVHPVATVDLPPILAAYAVGFTFSVLAFVVPGGVGVREAGLAAALAPALPTAVAVAVAVAVRLLQTAIELFYAALGLRSLRNADGERSASLRSAQSDAAG